MNKAIVVAIALLAACIAPPQTAWKIKNYGLFCDRMHACLNTPEAKNLPYLVFIGSNPEECKAAYNEADADTATRSEFGSRTFSAAQAEKCSDAVSKISCTDVKQLAYTLVDVSPAAPGSDTARAILTQAQSVLGVPATFSCVLDGQCNAAAAVCNLGTANGACAKYLVQPLKDANNAKAESDEYTKPMSAVGCGDFNILF